MHSRLLLQVLLSLKKRSSVDPTLRKLSSLLATQSSPKEPNLSSARIYQEISGISSRINQMQVVFLSRPLSSLDVRMLTQESVFMLVLMTHTLPLLP